MVVVVNGGGEMYDFFCIWRRNVNSIANCRSLRRNCKFSIYSGHSAVTLDAVVRCKCVFRAEIEEIHALNRHLWQGCQFNLKLDFGNVCDVAREVVCSGVGDVKIYKINCYYSGINIA